MLLLVLLRLLLLSRSRVSTCLAVVLQGSAQDSQQGSTASSVQAQKPSPATKAVTCKYASTSNQHSGAKGVGYAQQAGITACMHASSQSGVCPCTGWGGLGA